MFNQGLNLNGAALGNGIHSQGQPFPCTRASRRAERRVAAPSERTCSALARVRRS